MEEIKNELTNKRNVKLLVLGMLFAFIIIVFVGKVFSTIDNPSKVDEITVLKDEIVNLKAQIANQEKRYGEVVEHLTSYQSKIDGVLKELLVSLEKIETKTNNSEK